MKGFPPTERGLRSHIVPNYESDIELAWQVIEEMKKNGYSCDIQVSSTIRSPVITFARKEKLAVEYDTEILPEAICRAALRILNQ